MNKQQIINHIATRLNTLIANGGEQNIIREFSFILQQITVDDDYSAQQRRPSSSMDGQAVTATTPSFTYNTDSVLGTISGGVVSSH